MSFYNKLNLTAKYAQILVLMNNTYEAASKLQHTLLTLMIIMNDGNMAVNNRIWFFETTEWSNSLPVRS